MHVLNCDVYIVLVASAAVSAGAGLQPQTVMEKPCKQNESRSEFSKSSYFTFIISSQD